MEELISLITSVGIINWLLLVMGLTIHLLLRVSVKKLKQKTEFDKFQFADDYIKPALLATISSIACLIALHDGGYLDNKAAGFISMFAGYTNISVFRMIMDAVNKKAKSVTDNFPEEKPEEKPND